MKLLDFFVAAFIPRKLMLSSTTLGAGVFNHDEGEKRGLEETVVEIRIHSNISAEVRKTRIDLADGFIDEVLAKIVDDLPEKPEKDIAKLIVQYCEKQPDKDVLFETNVLLGRLFDRVGQYSAKFLHNGSEPPEELVLVYKLFKVLKDKDLELIDTNIDRE